MSRVIAAIDSSVASRPVLDMARAFGRVVGATADAVHVRENGDRTALAIAERAGVPLRVLAGEPLDRLKEEAARADVVAMVLGMRRTPMGTHPGHLACALAGATESPLIAVPPEAHPQVALHRVLVAMEGTAEKARQAKRVLEIADAAGLELIAVHVDDERSIPLFSDQVQYEASEYAGEFLARYAPGAPSAQVQLRVGDPVEEILAAADSLAPDLLVVGWPPTDDPTRGLVARRVVDRSHVPVLFVPLT